MANLLTITKKSFGYYDFVVNGDTVNIVTNDRNDMTGVGDLCHFKTFSGASIIRQQNITFGNVTLIDGSPLPVASSMDDLIAKLDSIDFYAWRDASGGGGSTTYEGLTDTQPFFGQNGRIPVVNEAQLRLDYTDIPDVSKLDQFPSPLVANKMLKVNAGATAYEFVDAPAGAGSYNQLFVYTTGAQTFTLGAGAKVNLVFYNSYPIKKDINYTITGNILTILPTITLVANDEIVAVGNI